MNASSRIPPLLQPYTKLPENDSLLLVTSTLGASANWLLIRFLCDALSSPKNSPDGGADSSEGHSVVLVSWLRDYDFWRVEARKGGGLDLERLRREKRFAFVDGLSGLVMGAQAQAQEQQTAQPVSPRQQVGVQQTQTQRPSAVLPARGPPARTIVPGRGPPAPAQPGRQPQTPMQTQTPSAPTPAAQPPNTPPQQLPGHSTLTSLDLAHLKTAISTAASSLPPQRKTLLLLDAPDLLLALSPHPPSALTALILHLHTLPGVSHVLTHLHADTPLLSESAPPQPLEVAGYNLLTKVAHMSQRVLGTRVLDTGVARDVSGVVRVTEQGVGWGGLGLEESAGEEAGRGKEFLYRVQGDGGVRVFERGAGGDN